MTRIIFFIIKTILSKHGPYLRSKQTNKQTKTKKSNNSNRNKNSNNNDNNNYYYYYYILLKNIYYFETQENQKSLCFSTQAPLYHTEYGDYLLG